MTALENFAGSVTIVVSSCDAFFDVWKPFTFFFRKQWPDCPLPVFLVTNELQVASSVIKSIPVGPDWGWATNLRVALDQITTTYVLYAQEDYFLTAPVNSQQLADDFSAMIALEADSLCFRARSHVEADFQRLNERFGVVPIDSDGRTRAQVTLWKRKSLRALLRDGESAWEMECRGSERTREMQILSYEKRDRAAIPYLMSAVVRGLWTREALALCRCEGVEIEPAFRGAYTERPLLRKYRRWQTRRRGAQELKRARCNVVNID